MITVASVKLEYLTNRGERFLTKCFVVNIEGYKKIVSAKEKKI